jgi:hypothetical protein
MSEAVKQASEKEGAIVPASGRALTNGGSSVSGYLAAHGVGIGGNVFQIWKGWQIPEVHRRGGNPRGNGVHRHL